MYIKSLVKHVKTNTKVSAFTLQELLIVLVIIGILVLLALPSLTPLITKAKSTEAKLQLEHLYKLQKIYHMEYSRYCSEIRDLSFEQASLVTSDPPGNANYKIEIISSNGQAFLARATAVVDFDNDGKFNTWEIDEQKNLVEVIKD